MPTCPHQGKCENQKSGDSQADHLLAVDACRLLRAGRLEFFRL
jgi:hypothetical protein